MTEPLLIARKNTPLYLLRQMANRHGLVAGAIGTGKTVTFGGRFSGIGGLVFAADIKGDLSDQSWNWAEESGGMRRESFISMR